MADQTAKRSILDDILARVTVQSANGIISINSASLGKGKSQTVKDLQQELSDEGLYVSEGHRYYNDGYTGEITDFGLLMKADPSQAKNQISNALSDNNLSEKDILKLQIALNASTDDKSQKIKVLGKIDTETANRLADYLAENKTKINPNSALGKALQQHADPEKLQALNIDSKSNATNSFNDAGSGKTLAVTPKPIKTEAPENVSTAKRFNSASDQVSIAQTPNTEKLSRDIIDISRSDNAHGGYCAKGVANILEGLGIDHQRGHAYTWKDTLPQNGWVKLSIRPEDAPPGSVIVCDRNNRGGGSGGARYGHVEVVAENEGGRYYVSDKARSNWGGSVPENFVGVYVHPEIAGNTDPNVMLANNGPLNTPPMG